MFASLQSEQVRIYEWVDLQAPDCLVDPELVGSVVAAIHRVRHRDSGALDALDALDPWSSEPVGADRWDQLVDRLGQAGAPFASRLADLRDELVCASDYLTPNLCSPDRTDSAAWIAGVFDEPHTRELLDSLLGAVRDGAARA